MMVSYLSIVKRSFRAPCHYSATTLTSELFQKIWNNGDSRCRIWFDRPFNDVACCILQLTFFLHCGNTKYFWTTRPWRSLTWQFHSQTVDLNWCNHGCIHFNQGLRILNTKNEFVFIGQFEFTIRFLSGLNHRPL